MTTLSEIIAGRQRRQRALEGALNSILAQIQALGALKVVLFGSVARGEADAFSDLDLLVIMPSERSGREWTGVLYDSLERGVASDIVVYNLEEFEQMLPHSSFLQTVISSGRVVYERHDGTHEVVDPG